MIREATKNDAEAITEIYNYYIENSVIPFEEVALHPSDFIKRIKKVQDSGLSWLIAEQNSKVIGYAYAAKWNKRAAYKNTVEVSIYLSNQLKSKGWGTKLYNALFAILQTKSIHTVISGITLPNTASVALHEKFGMEKVAHFKEVGYKIGKWLDVGYWQVKLDS